MDPEISLMYRDPAKGESVLPVRLPRNYNKPTSNTDLYNYLIQRIKRDLQVKQDQQIKIITAGKNVERIMAQDSNLNLWGFLNDTFSRHGPKGLHIVIDHSQTEYESKLAEAIRILTAMTGLKIQKGGKPKRKPKKKPQTKRRTSTKK